MIRILLHQVALKGFKIKKSMSNYLKLIWTAFLGRWSKSCSVIGLWLPSVLGYSKTRYLSRGWA